MMVFKNKPLKVVSVNLSNSETYAVVTPVSNMNGNLNKEIHKLNER